MFVSFQPKYELAKQTFFLFTGSGFFLPCKFKPFPPKSALNQNINLHFVKKKTEK